MDQAEWPLSDPHLFKFRNFEGSDSSFSQLAIRDSAKGGVHGKNNSMVS